jgi:hypothetical protein
MMGAPTDEDNRKEATNQAAEALGGAFREQARTMLEGVIERKEAEIAGLRALLDALPAKLPAEADQALWLILCQWPRL